MATASVKKLFECTSARELSHLHVDKTSNLNLIESMLNVKLHGQDHSIEIRGKENAVASAYAFLTLLQSFRDQGILVRQTDFEQMLTQFTNGHADEMVQLSKDPLILHFKKRKIVPKTLNQQRYTRLLREYDIVFGIGPAGTGKTYLATAIAIQSFLNGEVEKIIITRPAVEAGEALGFLPGDLNEKILPYLRPLYDAFYDMLGKEETEKLITHGQIEIAPLAYMRGRTLANAFIILDEAQNTTSEQMLMFLTRLGNGSRMVITGDITQIDLPSSKKSGLKQAIQILKNVPPIQIFQFQNHDVVRHPLVQKIITAYEVDSK